MFVHTDTISRIRASERRRVVLRDPAGGDNTPHKKRKNRQGIFRQCKQPAMSGVRQELRFDPLLATSVSPE